ncbi:MAG: dicarboxylate/amino acid:cation symporter [Bacillota bacterium]
MFENVAIDSWQQALLYVFALGGIGCLWMMSKHKVSFSKRVFVGLLIGLVLGVVFGSRATTLRPIGSLFVRLIMMVVVPLVFTSIIKSFTDLKDKNALKTIGLKSLFWLLSTTAIATVLALIAANLFSLGLSFDVSDISYEPREVIPIEEVILDLFPENIVGHMAEGQMIPVILFAVFLAVAMMIERERHPERIEPFKRFIDSFQSVMVRLTKIVIRFAPYGVLALIASAAGRNSLEALRALGLYIVVFYAVMILHFIVVHLGLITFVGKLNPIQFIKNVHPAQIVGFSSQSSIGTLPVTIRSLKERNGVSEEVASFVSPLGANVGMNACGGMFPAFVAIITANAFGLELVWTDYFLIVLMTIIASIGIAGVPGIASIAATVVLAGLGLPLEGIGLVIGVDALIDMGRTALNITGTMVAATLTAKSEDALDFDIYQSDNQPI